MAWVYDSETGQYYDDGTGDTGATNVTSNFDPNASNSGGITANMPGRVADANGNYFDMPVTMPDGNVYYAQPGGGYIDANGKPYVDNTSSTSSGGSSTSSGGNPSGGYYWDKPITMPDGSVYYLQPDGSYIDQNGNPYQEKTAGTSTGSATPTSTSTASGNPPSAIASSAAAMADKAKGILSSAQQYLTSKGINLANLATPANALAALGGIAAYNLNTPKTALFKGTIPNLSAVRSEVPLAPHVPYTGQGFTGQKFFTDTTYVDPAVKQQAQDLANAQAIDMANAATVKKAAGGPLDGLYQQFSFAHGGQAGQPQYLRGNSDGMADKLDTSIDGVQPAKLSHGEFVVPADVVSHLGNGNSDAGADVLYKMMDRVRQARTGTKKQGKRIEPEKYTGGIAGYASGGSVKHFATGDSVTDPASNVTGTPPNTTATTSGITASTPTSSLAASPYGYSQQTSLAPWVGNYVTNMLGQGQALANAPYQAYTGQITAGTSPLQNQAFNTASNMTTPGSISAGANTLGNIATSAEGMQYNPVGSDFTTAAAQQYMNPFLNVALAPQLAELQRQNDIANMNTNAKLTAAGGFGGGRQAVYNAENQRNMMQQMNQTLGQGYLNAFQNAQAQFNADQARKTQEAQFGANYGLQGLNTAANAAQGQVAAGTAQNQANLANLGILSTLGGTQRDIEQQGLTAAQNEFNVQRENPYKMVQFEQSLLSGLPLATTAVTPNLSPSQQIAAAGSDMTKLYSLLQSVPGFSGVSQQDFDTAFQDYLNQNQTGP